MKLTLRYMKTYARSIACVIAMKLVSTICELLLPLVMAEIVDVRAREMGIGNVFKKKEASG